MDPTEEQIKLFQQQVVNLLQEKEKKTEKQRKLRSECEHFEKKHADALIRLSILKLEILDIDSELRKLFSNDYKL